MLRTRLTEDERRERDRVKVIHDGTEEAARYPCARMDCANRATLVYQGPRHPAIYGACDEHRP